MTGRNPPLIFQRATDHEGNPAPGAALYHYVTNTTIPKAIFSSYTLTPGTELPQPLIADSEGNYPQYFLEPGQYTFREFDAPLPTGSQLRAPADHIEGAGGDAYVLPPATDTTIGGVKEGPGTSIAPDGTISTTYDNIPGPDLALLDPETLVVQQLTGVGAGLEPVATDFSFPANPGPFPPSRSGGRGISAGFSYVGGVQVASWCAQANRGDLFWTFDLWKTSQSDQTLRTAFPAITNWNSLAFVYMARFSSYAWIAGEADPTSTIYYALHTPANYNGDGTIKSTAWGTISYPAGAPNQPADFATAGNVTCWVGNDYEVARTADFLTFTTPVTLPSIPGGIATDSYGTWFVVCRDTGVLYRSIDDAATWSLASSIFVDGVAATHIPIDHGEQWGSILGAYGLWVVPNVNPASGSLSYVWSEDGLHWYTFTGEFQAFYSSGFDGVRFYATNEASGATTSIYQLLISSIPVHRRLAMEKGFASSGPDFMTSLPGLVALGTDQNGKVKESTYGASTLASRLSREVWLEDYKADAGSGSGNDYSAWLLAMADLSSGGTLRLAPNKTYAMDPGPDGRLDTHDFVHVVGSGPSSVIYLTATESERGAMRIRNGGVFRDFRIDGPSGARQNGMNACGIIGLNSSGASIERVEVSGVCGAGINMQGASGYLISHCHVHDTMADGIHSPKVCTDFVIQANLCEDNGDDSISVVGYRESGTLSAPSNGLIIGNTCKNGAARGITVVGGAKIKILANDIYDCQVAGILLNSEAGSYDTHPVTDCVVAYNTLDRIGRTHRSGQTGTYNFTISVRGRSSQRNKNIQIYGNTIRDSSGINASTGSPVGCNALSIAYTDGLRAWGNTIDGTPTGTDSLNTLRWLYAENSTDIELDDNTCMQCTQIGVYLASTVTGKVRVTKNKFLDPAISGAYSVIYSDSSTASLVIESNEEDHPTGTPDYFLNLPSGTDTASFSFDRNDTTLSNNGTIPENLPYAQFQSYDTFTSFPALGKSTKVYLARDTGKTYYANETVTLWTSNASIWDARGICAGPDGCLYMCIDGGSIYRGVRSGSTVTWTTTGAASGAWRGITTGSDGCLYATVSNAGAGTAGIWRGVVVAGVVTWSNVVTTARLWQGITAGPDGILYAVVSAGDTYRGVIVGTTLTMTAMGGTSRAWRGIVWHSQDRCLYATVDAGSIYRLTDAGGTVLSTDLAATSRAWRSICIGPDGHLATVVESGLVYRGILSPDSTLSLVDIGVPSAGRWGICNGQDNRLHMTIINNVTQRRSTPYQVSTGGILR